MSVPSSDERLDIEKGSATDEIKTDAIALSAPPAPAAGAGPPGVGPPPDGGFQAWLMVACGFSCLFCSFGIVNAFGVYQNYYQTVLMPEEDPSTISWIGTIQAFFIFGGTLFVGRLIDAGYVQQVVYVGSFLVVFGQMMTSLGKNFYQIFLAQGLCVGLGCGFLFSSSVSVVPTYFLKRRATAVGIVASGSSLAGVIVPVMAQRLFVEVGFGWATRIIGFLSLVLVIPPALFLRSRLPPRKLTVRSFIDLDSLNDPSFIVFTLAMTLVICGLFIPLFYIEPFSDFISAKPNVSTYIVAILNSASVFGRIVPNLIADRLGSINALLPCCYVTAVLAFVWLAVDNTGGLVVFALLFGFFSGAFVSIPPSVMANITKDMPKLGTRLGMAFFVVGLGLLAGPAPAGQMIINSGNYRTAGIYSGCLMMAGGVLFTLLRVLEVRKRGISFLSRI